MLKRAELKWQTWVAESVGEMLARAPALTSPPKREHISIAISRYLKRVTGGNVSAAARQLRLSRRTLLDLQRGT